MGSLHTFYSLTLSLSLSLSFLPLVCTSALPRAKNQPNDLVDAFPVLDFCENGRAAVSVVLIGKKTN